jgi:hypothetical protein
MLQSRSTISWHEPVFNVLVHWTGPRGLLDFKVGDLLPNKFVIRNLHIFRTLNLMHSYRLMYFTIICKIEYSMTKQYFIILDTTLTTAYFNCFG